MPCSGCALGTVLVWGAAYHLIIGYTYSVSIQYGADSGQDFLFKLAEFEECHREPGTKARGSAGCGDAYAGTPLCHTVREAHARSGRCRYAVR